MRALAFWFYSLSITTDKDKSINFAINTYLVNQSMDHFHQYKQRLFQQKEHLLKTYPIKTLGLFGSVVRNDFAADSDIDVIVEFTRPVGMEFIELAEDLEKILQRKVDLVSRKGLRPQTFDFIKQEIEYV